MTVTREATLEEANAIGVLNEDGGHRNVIKVILYGWNNSQRLFYIDMAYCDFNLRNYIYKDFSTPESENLQYLSGFPYDKHRTSNCWDVIQQICNGVKYIHDRNLVHRDLKPDNGTPISQSIVNTIVVLFSRDDKVWKITDFGFTTGDRSGEAIHTVHCRGTVGYRAPELLKDDSNYTKSVDIWAIGCILYEVVTQKMAFPVEGELRSLAISQHDSPYSSLRFDEDTGRDFSPFIEAMLEVVESRRPTAVTLHKQFSINLWQSIGDALKGENNLDLAVEAYKKGTTAVPTYGPLWERLIEAKEAIFQRQVQFTLAEICL